MRLHLLIFFVCLLNISVIRTEIDDDDTDEEIALEDPTATSKTAAPPPIEKGNVPTIKSSSSNIFFEDQFQDKNKWSRWVKSQAKKDGVDEILAKYDGEWAFEVPHTSAYNDDYALILKVNQPEEKPSSAHPSPSLLVQSETSRHRCQSTESLRLFHQSAGCPIRSEISNQSRMWWCLCQITFQRGKSIRFSKSHETSPSPSPLPSSLETTDRQNSVYNHVRSRYVWCGS